MSFPQGAERRNRGGSGQNDIFVVLLDRAAEMLKTTILLSLLEPSLNTGSSLWKVLAWSFG